MQLSAETRLALVKQQHTEMRRLVAEDRFTRLATSDTVEPAVAASDRIARVRRHWIARIPAMLGRRLARGF